MYDDNGHITRLPSCIQECFLHCIKKQQQQQNRHSHKHTHTHISVNERRHKTLQQTLEKSLNNTICSGDSHTCLAARNICRMESCPFLVVRCAFGIFSFLVLIVVVNYFILWKMLLNLEV